MFQSVLAALFIKVRLRHHLAPVFFDNTDRKHLTLIRINSGREEANSPI
ncbi:hypothetical protein L2725_13360 [Shewanella corallii]|uniref:Uncharacterized protein n=2 Tax=Shewanella TaxID=22 RepID=A0ABT0N8F6_9GAMM|nr:MULTISPECIES: hypothetical protein [Shewanella]MCL1039063.1 hypothetical protein [Shewanella submarina]MCL2914758.1 hypothetical protein [Shewanella corallii]